MNDAAGKDPQIDKAMEVLTCQVGRLSGQDVVPTQMILVVIRNVNRDKPIHFSKRSFGKLSNCQHREIESDIHRAAKINNLHP
jgi:hypothetical protein